MTIDEIRELIMLASETGVAELEVQRGDSRVRIRRSFGSETTVLLPPGPTQSYALPSAPASLPSKPTLGGLPGKTSGAQDADAPAAETSSLIYQTSPIVGTFYETPSPDSPPFVQVGDKVPLGKILCIIESMKLMNEIESEVAGIVEVKLVKNGQPVEYGEKLFGIRPV